jgi:hypothetical protein
MKTVSLLCAMAAAAAFAGPADAIYKCTTARGVVYQDRPCREGSETDVRLVIPTGELAPKTVSTPDGEAQAGAPRIESHFGARTPDRAPADAPATLTRPADKASGEAVGARKSAAQPAAQNSPAPLTADEARRTDPTAKYYATEAFGPDGETPAQMNCESPSGEKRVFYLSNGKLTSI